MSEAKVKVSLFDGVLEIEGSESFVSEQLAQFKETIQIGLGSARRPKTPPASPPPDPNGESVTVPGDLAEVFAVTDTGVQILKDIPGSSKAEKMVNAAKLLLYGSMKLKQKDIVLFEEVAAVCRKHGCYDGANMAKALKDEHEAFVHGGRGRKQTLKLTVPGEKAAAKMVDALKAASQDE